MTSRSHARRVRGHVVCLVLLLLSGGTSTTASAQESDASATSPEAAPEEKPADDETEGEAPTEETAEDAGAPAPPEGVEVIYVKGETTQGFKTDVSESVTQFDAEAIQALGAANVADLAKVTPGLEIKTAGATAPTFYIRGVGLNDFAANAAGAVAVYQDDVARNTPAIQLGRLFDVETVDVLRGPQGWGSGRNASAGAIKVFSKRPTGELDAFLRSSFGNYNLRDFEGAIETPVVEGMLASRLAFRVTERDPIRDNQCGRVEPFGQRAPNPAAPPGTAGGKVPPLQERFDTPAPAWTSYSFCGEVPRRVNNPTLGGTPAFRNNFSPIPGGLDDEVNDWSNWAARGQMLFEPPGLPDMEWLFNGHGSRLDELSVLGEGYGTGTGVNQNLGQATAAGFQPPEVTDMLEEIRREENPPPPAPPAPPAVVLPILADKLARHLDKKPYRGQYNRTGDTTLDTWGGFARGDWTLGDVTLTSVSGYDAWKRWRDQDQDFTPDILFESETRDNAWQVSQELKAAGELPDQRVNWEMGAYYLQEDIDSSQRQFFNDVPSIVFRELQLDYEQKLYSWAAGAGFGWDFVDDFRLEGGVRWNWERKNFQDTLFVPNSTLDPAGVDERSTWQAPTGGLTLTYRFAEDKNIYWKYGRGWKGGHYNALPQLNLGATKASPEKIDAFAIGTSGFWWDGRLGLRGELFYYQYQDYQVLIVEDSAAGPPAVAIINANDAQVYGGEIDARIEPFQEIDILEGLVVTGTFGWLESQYLDFTDEVVTNVPRTDGTIVQLIQTRDYTGNRLINSPEFKASVAVDWTLDFGRWGALLPRYDLSWSDEIFFDPSEGRGSPNPQNQLYLPDNTIGEEALLLHNVRLGYRTENGTVEIAGWVRNITDEVYKSYAFDASTFSRVVVQYTGEPRTFGLDFIVKF
jgi:outer membrane receptor protein involved in Fe transport